MLKHMDFPARSFKVSKPVPSVIGQFCSMECLGVYEFTNVHCLISQASDGNRWFKSSMPCNCRSSLPFQPSQKAKSEIKPRFELCSESRLQTKSHGWKIPRRAGVFMDFLVWSRIKRLFLLIGTKNQQSRYNKLLVQICEDLKNLERMFDGLWWMFFRGFVHRFFDLQAAAAWGTSELKPPSWRNCGYENWICFRKATGFRNQDFLPLFQQVLEMISVASTVVCSEKDDRICIE